MSTPATPEAFVSARETWTVERALGAGGAGRTWLVRAASSGERCVLKELHLAALEEWKQLELFERELRVMRSLEHAGIPRVVDVLEDGEGHPKAIVQTFVSGRTLRQQLDAEGPLDRARFERTLREALEILVYLHGHVPPIVHRDINPRNVMLDAERTWLIDFGAVRWVQRESTELTSVGTFGYMPPEQILGRAVAASDLYALGVTMIEVATGRSPADWPTDAQSGAIDARAVLDGVPGLGRKVRDTLLAMTRPGLAERIESADAALRLLERGAPREAAASRPVAVATPAPSPPSRTLFVVAGALVVLAAGGFFVLGSGGGASAPAPSEVATAPQVVQTAVPEPVPATPPPPAPPPVERPTPPPPELPPPMQIPVEVERGTVAADQAVRLEVDSEPQGALVRMGAAELGTTPVTLTLPYGKHTLSLEHGGRTVRRTVNMLEDSRIVVRFETATPPR